MKSHLIRKNSERFMRVFNKLMKLHGKGFSVLRIARDIDLSHRTISYILNKQYCFGPKEETICKLEKYLKINTKKSKKSQEKYLIVDFEVSTIYECNSKEEVIEILKRWDADELEDLIKSGQVKIYHGKFTEMNLKFERKIVLEN